MLTPEQRWANLCDAMAESVLTMTDEEILEDCRERGVDIHEEAEKVKALLLGALDRGRDSWLSHQRDVLREGQRITAQDLSITILPLERN